MSRKNIILFAGKNGYFQRRERERWIEAFGKKYDSANIETIHTETVQNWRAIEQQVETVGLFAEKRLFSCIGNTPKKKTEGEHPLITLCERVPDDTFLLFSQMESTTADLPFLSWITREGDVRKFDSFWDAGLWEKYFELNTTVIEQALRVIRSQKKEENSSLSYEIAQLLEKLTLLPPEIRIIEDLLRELIGYQLEESLFTFLDALLARDITRSLTLLDQILREESVMKFLPWLLGNLRNIAYILTLEWLKKSEKPLPIKPFFLQKRRDMRLTPMEFFGFYRSLSRTSSRSKSGRTFRESELWCIFEIQLAIMSLKK